MKPAADGPDALHAARLFAVDPHGLGGVRLKAPAGPPRDRWIALLRQALPPGTPMRRVPANIGDDRLLGGLDLAATLAQGRPVAQAGLLAETDGGVLLLPMAERLGAAAAARIASVLDRGEVVVEREGPAARRPARLGVVALDEGAADDEAAPAGLTERLAFWITIDRMADVAGDVTDVTGARERLPRVRASDEIIEALCQAAAQLGIDTARAPLLALRVAQAAAALAGRDTVEADDAALAARLVLGPRATRWPAPPDAPPAEAEPPPEPPPDDEAADASEDDLAASADAPLAERVLQAVRGHLPAGLLAQLALGVAGAALLNTAGSRAGALKASRLRGRPLGSRRGDPRGGARLHVLDTLRAAAPWQPLRRRESPAASKPIHLRREDFRVHHYAERRETTTVFAVDASGSAALHRLAEAKGAVELLLADCYVRRDRVAVLAFRGAGAELLLPPSRSLVRAKRSLAGLPGGGGTPLASGLDAARAMVDALRRQGGSVVLVVLTDGRANIARDGSPGRERARTDALASARALRAAGCAALLIDTSPQAHAEARAVADAMGARYLLLPNGDAKVISASVRAVA